MSNNYYDQSYRLENNSILQNLRIKTKTSLSFEIWVYAIKRNTRISKQFTDRSLLK